MNILKYFKVYLGIFTFILLSMGMNKCNIVKADALLQTSNLTSTTVRATSVKTNRVIVVPKKSDLKNNSKECLSRGSIRRNELVSYSFKFLGTPYVWGASGPSSFDCSGFTAYVYKVFGVQLDHYTGSQYKVGTAVSNKSELLPGDLIFFNTYESTSHVGIYIGDGQFVHASSGGGKVIISDFFKDYYITRYAGARRIL